MVRVQLRSFQNVVGFLDKGTLINISFVTRKRQILQGKVLEFFSEIIFQLSKKGRGDLPLSPPPRWLRFCGETQTLYCIVYISKNIKQDARNLNWINTFHLNHILTILRMYWTKGGTHEALQTAELVDRQKSKKKKTRFVKKNK